MERRGKPLAPYLVDQIRRLRREGLSIRAIEQLTGCSHATVQRYTKGLPVPGNPQRAAPLPRMDDDQEGELDALFLAHDQPPDEGDLCAPA